MLYLSHKEVRHYSLYGSAQMSSHTPIAQEFAMSRLGGQHGNQHHTMTHSPSEYYHPGVPDECPYTPRTSTVSHGAQQPFRARGTSESTISGGGYQLHQEQEATGNNSSNKPFP